MRSIIIIIMIVVIVMVATVMILVIILILVRIGIRVKSGGFCVEGHGLASLVQAHICMKGIPRSFVQT